ncbi:MAG: hypothetical protein JW837_14645 [Sedimentisphaerales bacterium]|nr:hypothetical protein [Sedimentisphaerales bacterium]
MVYRRKVRKPKVVINDNTDKQSSFYEKHFWKFIIVIILISIFLRVFDFSLKPVSYKDLFINRPFCGLHSWAGANRAWAARSHVKYGLGYTRGYHTLAVGDPPPVHPQRYVSHPAFETLIGECRFILLGALRLFS